MTGDAKACRALGEYLTGSEAQTISDVLDDGGTLSQALSTVARSRRGQISRLLRAAGVGVSDRERSSAVLGAVVGAYSHSTAVAPVWTAPGGLAKAGTLTASTHHLVASARTSIVCSTYNFQRSSALWSALKDTSERASVRVRLYIDTAAADDKPAHWKPSTREIAREMRGATVMRTRESEGKLFRNHAKFVAVDHQFIIVTSANFSMSAEQHNVELGLRIDDPALVDSIERQMRSLEAVCYENVQ